MEPAFAGNERVSRGKHCFALTHPSSECEWASEAAHPISTSFQPLIDPTRQYRRICRKWNNTSGRCPVAGCTYKHICQVITITQAVTNHFIEQCTQLITGIKIVEGDTKEVAEDLRMTKYVITKDKSGGNALVTEDSATSTFTSIDNPKTCSW